MYLLSEKMNTILSLPRLTSALRAFAVVEDEGQDVKKEDLVVKRLQKAKQQADSGLSWQQLSLQIHHHCKDLPEREVKDTVRDLNILAREMGMVNILFSIVLI